MRLIDADELWEKMYRYNDNEGAKMPYGDDDSLIHKDSACFLIENAPTIEPKQRWIPCSEETGDGYPEKDGFYYVTEQNYGFYLDADYRQRVTQTSHFKNGDFTDRFYTENSSNITAWMPLPEPYKGEQE